MTNDTRQKFEAGNILLAALLASSVIVLLELSVRGASEAAVRAIVRDSAKLAVICFCMAFSASSLRAFWRSNSTAWMLRNRRQLGLSFAGFHLLHLAALIALAVAFPSPFVDDLEPLTLVGGGLAYLFLVLQAATSNDAAVRKLGRRNWTLLHTVGSYYIWIIFTQSYLPRALEEPLYAPFAALLLGTLGIRLARRLRRPGPSAA